MRRPYRIDIFTIAFAAFIIYGSLLPFDFSVQQQDRIHATFLGIPITHVGLPDAMSNIALYLPLGLALRASLARRKYKRFTAAFFCLAFALLLSYGLELVQTIVYSRIASVGDVVCNVLGTAVGILVYLPESKLFGRFISALKRDLLRTPTALVAGVWTCVVALAALAPFDVTLDVSRIARAARHAYLWPFAKHADLFERVNQVTLAFQPADTVAPLRLWELRIAYVADVFMFLVLGVLLVHHWRQRNAGQGVAPVSNRWSPTTRTCVVTASFAMALTFVGLFVISVGFDATRILTRFLGGVAGAALYPSIIAASGWHQHAGSTARVQGMRRVIGVACILSVTYIVACELAPFRFDATTADSAHTRIEWIPLTAYLPNKLPHAILDALRQSFRFLTLGALIASFGLVAGTVPRWWLRITVGILTTSCVALLEFAQCWLPGRIPASTDALVAGVSATGGMVLAAALFNAYKRHNAEQYFTGATPVILNVEIPPPGKDAPVEPRPRQKVQH